MTFVTKSKSEDKRLLGKALFFRFYGNFHYMLQEGAYSEYKKLKIPPKTENRWREELFETLKKEIENEPITYKKIVLVGNLLSYGIKTDWVVSIIVDLLNGEIDTFSRILLCEELKRCVCNKNITVEVSTIVENQKKYMLSKSITVDPKYYQLSHMLEYDFSYPNIKKRINSL